MKKLLGAIAAAVLLGTGCAHDQQSTSQSEQPTPPRASVQGTGQGQSGGSSEHYSLSCQVIGTGGSGAAHSETSQSECVPSQATGSSQGAGLSGSTMGEASVSGSASQDNALSGSASEDTAIGGSANEGAAPDSAADDAFNNRNMGGAEGGGG